MNLPIGDVIDADGLSDKPVLLSSRTQLILLKAIATAELRYNWEDMSDVDWDEISDAIAQAEYEVLTEQAQMAIGSVAVQRSTNVSVSTFPYAVIFSTGTGYDGGNPTQLTINAGHVVLQANVHFTSGSATIGYVEIRRTRSTTTQTIARHDLSGVTVNYVNISAIDECQSGDFYELIIQSSVPITIQTGTFFPHLSAKVFL